jgi:malate dehydrogenase (quinone)
VDKPYEVVVVGGGVTGTAVAMVLAKYSNVTRIAILEKNSGVGEVNSHPLNNAQTSHDGGTETNYDLQHALKVKSAATMLRKYVVRNGRNGLYKLTHRMVLGVGAKEVNGLYERFKTFKPHYPDLALIGPKELARIEPKVMEGRDPNEPVCALISSQGFAINYQMLAQEFVTDAKASSNGVEIHYDTKVEAIHRENGLYVITTNHGVMTARFVEFAAGSYSLLFAQKLGYAKNLAILSVAGSFYSGGELLRGKVYRVQIKGMPFAATHGDPDILNQKDTRFGPTTKPVPLMERYHYNTFWDFIKLPLITLTGMVKLAKMIHRRKLYRYVLTNILYDLPFIGPRMFVRQARVIVPTIKHPDLKLRRGVGGVRPQIFNLTTGDLEMGDSSIVGENIIFNTTPSPGASICISNAKRDAKRIVAALGESYSFKEEEFKSDLE